MRFQALRQGARLLLHLPVTDKPSDHSAHNIGLLERGAGSLMGYDYAMMGAKDKAQDVIKQLTELSRRKYVSPMLIARVYAGLGDRHQAFASLEQGFQGRDYNMPYLRVDQTFDSLRSDPRFSVLLRRIGLS